MGVAVATTLIATQVGSASAATSLPDGYYVRPDNVASPLNLSDPSRFSNVASAPIKVLAGQSSTGWLHHTVWEGLDHKLYSRDGNGKVYLVSSTYCLRPSSLTIGQVIWLACQGADKALWVTNPTVKDGRLVIGGFRSMGGIFNGGAAITVKPGTREPMFVGTGVATGSNVYTRTPTESRWTKTNLFCKNRPEMLISNEPGIRAFFVCRGANDAVIAADLTSTGFSAARSLGGKTISTPAFVLVSGRWKVVVVGANNYIYYKDLRVVEAWKNTGLTGKSVSSGWGNLLA